MYSTCIHCQRSLGANESIEALPIGRRLAFDARRGRLWVVCRACERWNLTPFDARWEAIEQSERAFRNTQVRVSTDHIGLARLRDGTELVRIGEPQRPEFAAWRYGDQFGRRRLKAIGIGVGAVIGIGVAGVGAAALGVGLAVVAPLIHVTNMAIIISNSTKRGKRVALPDGGYMVPMGSANLIQSETEAGWGIDVGYVVRQDGIAEPPTGLFSRFRSHGNNMELGRMQLYGADSLPLLRYYLPLVNRGGAGRAVIQDGVAMIESAGGPAHFGKWAAGMRREWAAKSSFGDTGDLGAIPAPARLAFEMAINEDAERQALEGELAALERAWADAEEVAAIADNLLTPTMLTEKLNRLKER